jgi:glycosyltransferase involved in cell wall biosynthesis
MQTLVSICIPTYNGAEVLAQCLDSITRQARQGLEVVVCDDASSDETVVVAEDRARRHPCIRVVRNATNVGMDRNFARAANLGRGAFIWWSGQDDVFEPGAVDKLVDVLQRHPNLDLVYFNYRFVSGDLTREVAPPLLQIGKDALVSSAEEYFKVVDHAPSFLAATVMRRTLWLDTPIEKFFDTHYVQMGAFLHHLAAARVYLVADPGFVSCRIPEESWKRKGGQMLFQIHSGNLEVYDTVYRSDRNPLPRHLYARKMRDFLRMLPVRVITFGELGFRRTADIDRRMRKLFGRQPAVYWLYVWPLLHLPPRIRAFAQRLHRSGWTRWITRSLNRLLGWLAGRSTA